MSATLYPIPPGFFCVPSALLALTGADYQSVIFPALNRAADGDRLLDAVGPAYRAAALRVLNELGYACRPAREPTRRTVATWSARKYAWPLLLFVRRHVVVAYRERVFDNHAPHGPAAAEHPYARSIVEAAYLVQKRA